MRRPGTATDGSPNCPAANYLSKGGCSGGEREPRWSCFCDAQLDPQRSSALSVVGGYLGKAVDRRISFNIKQDVDRTRRQNREFQLALLIGPGDDSGAIGRELLGNACEQGKLRRIRGQLGKVGEKIKVCQCPLAIDNGGRGLAGGDLQTALEIRQRQSVMRQRSAEISVGSQKGSCPRERH